MSRTYCKRRTGSRTIDRSRPSVPLGRAVAWACCVGIFLLIAPRSSEAAAAEGNTAEPTVETAAAIESLKQPLLFSERYPFVIPLARFWVADPQPHLEAVRRLAELQVRTAIPTLISALGDRRFPYRAEAATVLGLMPDRSAAQPLLDALSDSDANTRRMAASGIGSLLKHDVMGSDTRPLAISSLEDLVRADPAPIVRYAAYKALLENGGEASFLSTLGLAGSNSEVLLRCTYARDRASIATVSGDERVAQDAATTLREALDDKDPILLRCSLARAFYLSRYPCASVRTEAARGLGLLRDRESVPLLAQTMVASSDGGFRAEAVAALGKIGGDAAIAGVLVGLKDPLPEVRKAAMFALVEAGDSAVGERLAEFLAHGGSYDRFSAVSAMRSIEGHYPALVQALADGNVQVRRLAEAALLQRETPESVRALTDALSTAPERCRTGAARVLGRYTGEESRERLLDILREGQEQEASLAALALGLRGEEESRAALELALLGSNRPNPVAVIHALQDLGRPAALSVLRSYLESPLPPEIRATGELAVMVLERVEAASS